VLRLYLLRHGIPGDGPDPELSPEGVSAIQGAVIGMARLGVTADLILSSPLKRAEGTARIVAGVITTAAGRHPRMLIEPLLSGGCGGSTLLSLLAAHRVRASQPGVLVVGHQPDMGRIAADLIGSEEPLPFGRGTLCCLELPDHASPGSASLVFFMPADLLARAG